MSQAPDAIVTPSGAQFSTLALEGAKAAEAGTWRRRLTVELRIEAEAGDDSPLSGLVTKAVREYLDSPAGRGEGESQPGGMFESKAGLDVHWRWLNRYYQDGKLIGETGVNDRGERVDSLVTGLVNPDPVRHAVPMAVAQMEGEDTIVIDGIRFSMVVFKTLANPDPAKRYAFVRKGDVVTVVERP